LKGKIKEYFEKKIQTICDWKHVEILEMTIMPDHIHMVAIAVSQQHERLRAKPYWDNHLWSCGYGVTTVGIDEERIRRYVKYQEDAERLSEDHELREGLF
jgi:putative transposase